jgi:hypothetical protein
MILLVAALVVLGLLLIAHVHGHVIALLRAAGEMVLGVFDALLHAIEQLRQGLSALSTRAWEGLRNHHGRGRTTDYWAGWAALVPLIAAVLVGMMVAADYLLAVRIGYLLGLPPHPINAPLLDRLLGVLYVTMGVTLGIAWADAHGVSPAGESLFFSRLDEGARRRLAKWLRWAVVLVLVDAVVLMLWSVQAALLSINDPVSAGVFLMLFAVLVNGALIAAMLPALHVPAIVWVFALAVLYVLLFLAETALWGAAFVLAHIVAVGEAVIDLVAAIGRTMWNLAVSTDSERRIEDPKPRKLIGEKLPRPQLVSPQTVTTPQPAAPATAGAGGTPVPPGATAPSEPAALATAGAGGDARANGHTTGTPEPIETLIAERE